MATKLEIVKNNRLSSIAEDVHEKVENIKECFNEANIIFEKVSDNLSSNDDIESLNMVEWDLSTYGRYIYISNVKSKNVYDSFIIALSELYIEGDKESYDGDIRYNFTKRSNEWRNRMYIILTIPPNVTGCRLVKEYIDIEEKIIPMHIEEKLVVKCDNDE